MGRSSGARAVIGLLILVGVGAAGFLGTRLAQGAFDEDYRFEVVVGESGQGLVEGSDVAFRGVLIGKVGQIQLNDDLLAQVELILEPQYEIPTDARFEIVGKTLFGEKQLEILYEGDPQLAAAHIPDGDLVDDPSALVEVQDVLEHLDDLLGAIDPDDLAVVVDDGLGTFVGQEDSIARAIDQGARATDVFSRSLDDQVPTLRDLSLVAEALGPVGDEFNRLGAIIDGGALDTITVNQARLQVLLAELNRFSDTLDVVLELTRPDLDRLIIEGDNVTRVLFAYRPEIAELVEGIDDYSDTIGNGGQTHPSYSGFAAGFQILLDNPIHPEDICAGLPAELAPLLPGCAGGDGGGDEPPAIPVPDLPVLATVPAVIPSAPQPSGDGGVEQIISAVLGDLGAALGGAQGD